MQKPTIKMKFYVDKNMTTYTVVSDTEGVEHIYWYNEQASVFHKIELAKWQAEQIPQVLFESETIKVMKFADVQQLLNWKNDNGCGILGEVFKEPPMDCNQPILIEKLLYSWWIIGNITTDLIQAVQSVNVATPKIRWCGCGCELEEDDNFCPNCGKTLIKEAE